MVESALTGRRLGAQHCLVVSALGANADSTFLYNRTKGEMEQALRERHWPRLDAGAAFHAGGDRPAPRLMERLTLPLFRLLPGKWRAVSAKDVAQTLLQQAFTPGEGSGCWSRIGCTATEADAEVTNASSSPVGSSLSSSHRSMMADVRQQCVWAAA